MVLDSLLQRERQESRDKCPEERAVGQFGYLIHLPLARIQTHGYTTIRGCGICSLFSGQEDEENQFWLEMIRFCHTYSLKFEVFRLSLIDY